MVRVGMKPPDIIHYLSGKSVRVYPVGYPVYVNDIYILDIPIEHVVEEKEGFLWVHVGGTLEDVDAMWMKYGKES